MGGSTVSLVYKTIALHSLQTEQKSFLFFFFQCGSTGDSVSPHAKSSAAEGK